MIFHKFWSAFVAQINKVANLFWEADPIAQMRYESTGPSSSSRRAAAASSSIAAWSSASRGRSSANRATSRSSKPRPRPTSRPATGTTAAKFALELQKAKEELASNEAAAATCTRRPTATA